MKYVCTVCGWSTESDKAPEKCPLCGATTFKAIGDGEKVYATEHKVGDGKVEDKEVMDGLRAHFRRMHRSWYVSCNGKGCGKRRLSGSF